MDKYLSLGNRCGLAQCLRLSNLRESGPFDWIYNTRGVYSIIPFIMGFTYTQLLKLAFDQYVNDDLEIATKFRYDPKIIFLHEDLSKDQELKKVVGRFHKFHKLQRENSLNLIWWSNFEESETNGNINPKLFAEVVNDLEFNKLIVINGNHKNTESISKISSKIKLVTSKYEIESYYELPKDEQEATQEELCRIIYNCDNE